MRACECGLTVCRSSDQALINGGLTIWAFLVSLGCAFLVDRVGRRTLFLSAGVGMLITFSVWTACSAVYAQTGNSSAGSAVLAMIFLFYGGKLSYHGLLRDVRLQVCSCWSCVARSYRFVHGRDPTLQDSREGPHPLFRVYFTRWYLQPIRQPYWY